MRVDYYSSSLPLPVFEHHICITTHSSRTNTQKKQHKILSIFFKGMEIIAPEETSIQETHTETNGEKNEISN